MKVQSNILVAIWEEKNLTLIPDEQIIYKHQME